MPHPSSVTPTFSIIMAFTVIIAGGSIAGLTLALILERYGIDYILLEKYASIAPQLGASIGIMPYGSRIYDQLGVHEKVQALCGNIDKVQIFGPDGVQLGSQDGFSNVTEEL